MEELVVSNDGCYALCFKNFKKFSNEDVENIFQKYGEVHSVRQSTESVPWCFIRYKCKEEAQKALDELHGYGDFVIQVARSNPKKKQEQSGDRQKSDCSEGSRENRSMKGAQNRNRVSERFIMDSDDDNFDTRTSFKNAPYNRKQNNFAERPIKDKEEDDFNHSDKVDEAATARAFFPKTEAPDGRLARGREKSENSRRSFDSSPPRMMMKKSPGNHSVNGALECWKKKDCGPPELVKGSEYYGLANQTNSTTRSLALRAAYEEVWANHPLRSELQLREVILTNFDWEPSKKDIYAFCSPVKPLHVSFGRTATDSIYSRVLVSTDEDVEHLCGLNNESSVCVTTMELLLDIYFTEDNEK